MSKLQLIPEQATYSVDITSGVRRASIDGGVGRYRKDFEGTAKFVDVTFQLGETDYSYFMAFYTTVIEDGSLAFTVDLIIDDSILTEYTARIVPGSLTAPRATGFSFQVSCQMEVTPIIPDDEFNEALVAVYQGYDPATANFLAALENLTNVEVVDHL